MLTSTMGLAEEPFDVSAEDMAVTWNAVANTNANQHTIISKPNPKQPLPPKADDRVIDVITGGKFIGDASGEALVDYNGNSLSVLGVTIHIEVKPEDVIAAGFTKEVAREAEEAAKQVTSKVGFVANFQGLRG